MHPANLIQKLFLKSTPVPPLSFFPSLFQHIKPYCIKKPFCFNEYALFWSGPLSPGINYTCSCRRTTLSPKERLKFEFAIVSYQEREVGTCNAGDSAGQVCIQNTSETTGINHYREKHLTHTTPEPIFLKSSTCGKWFMLLANGDVMGGITSPLNYVLSQIVSNFVDK